jgi:hypothetical protein
LWPAGAGAGVVQTAERLALLTGNCECILVVSHASMIAKPLGRT